MTKTKFMPASIESMDLSSFSVMMVMMMKMSMVMMIILKMMRMMMVLFSLAFYISYMLVKFYKVETRSVEKYEAPDSKLFWSV